MKHSHRTCVLRPSPPSPSLLMSLLLLLLLGDA
jgi:hypothetical protein